MLDWIKRIWVGLFMCVIFEMMLTPIYKYQEAYNDYMRHLIELPSQHLDYNVFYEGYVNAGGTLSFDQFMRMNRMFDRQRKKEEPQKRKPYYIRDKNNPNILYPYVEE